MSLDELPFFPHPAEELPRETPADASGYDVTVSDADAGGADFLEATPPKRRRGRPPASQFMKSAATPPQRRPLAYLVYFLEPYSTTVMGSACAPPRKEDGQRLIIVGATMDPAKALQWLDDESDSAPRVAIVEVES